MMKWNYLSYVALAQFLSMTCSNPVSALSTTPEKPQTVSISLGAEFASGKYGTDSTTRSVYVPLTVTWSPNERFDIGIEVPFIYQNSSNVTTSLYSISQSSPTTAVAAKGGPGGNSGAILQHQAGTSSASGSSSDVSGIGDIILRFGVIALFEGDTALQLRPSLFVKFPTASTSDGLGTGEFDFGVGVDASKWYGDLHLIGEGLYTWQGRVDGFGLKNYFSYTAGVGYQLTKSVEPMLLVKGATAPSSYSGALLEARPRVVWSLTDTTMLDLYGSLGIADSSPDYGGGIAVIYSF